MRIEIVFLEDLPELARKKELSIPKEERSHKYVVTIGDDGIPQTYMSVESQKTQKSIVQELGILATSIVDKTKKSR